jgi:DNA repair exonuclease SbcCD ATPase subunit
MFSIEKDEIMDLDQLSKRLDWLDGERRKDRLIIQTLEERLSVVEGSMPSLLQQVKEISGEVTRLSAMLSKFDQIDAAIAQIRVDSARAVEAVDKSHLERSREMEKVRLSAQEGLSRTIAEVRRGLEPIPELRKSLQSRMEEDFRLARLIEEANQKILEYRRSDEEYRRAQKLLEEAQRQEAKRITDVAGEVAALRKRQDEQRGKIDLASDSARKVELRIGEFQTAEGERRQAMTAFVDKQNMAAAERDRIWKEWQGRFDLIERQGMGLDAQLQAIEATHRSIKRSQEAFDEITQRFDRRINEITEMQRLTEDRFRQEWVAFKADDQKRWTNYALVQEEQQREQTRHFERSNERTVLLEDVVQEMQDLIHQIREENQKRLQSLLAVAHEWVEQYDRVFGRSG